MPFLRIVFLFLMIATGVDVHAQLNLIGAGISYANDRYKYDDPHGTIRAVPLPGPEITIYWRRTFKNEFFTQLGVSTKPYWEGFAYNGTSSYLLTPAFTAIKLNADIGRPLRLTKRLCAVPRAGVSTAINTATYIASGSAIVTTQANGAVIHGTYQESEDVNRVFLLVHGAIGLEYDFHRPFVLSIQAGYHAGFMKSNVLNVQYTIGQSPTYYATATSRGEYWDLGVGIAYKFGMRAP